MDAGDEVRPGQAEQVVVAALVAGRVGEARSAVVRLLQAVLLDHRAHRAVEYQDPLLQRGEECFGAGRFQPRQRVHCARSALPRPPAGLRPISAITSKCGGRRSRVAMPQLVTCSPARVVKRSSSLAVKPRLTWP